MATGLVSWSTTAATNATADSAVNWAEGQAPSSVNDSARAMMASMAKWLADNNGSLTTGGGTTAYTATTSQGFATLAALHRQSLRLLWSLTCATTPTLNVDGLGAKNIVSTVGTNIGAGALLANCVYDVVYDNNNSVFIVIGAPATFPAGTIMLFAQTAAPTGWTKLTATDDAALRLTTGTASSGGTANFTTAFAARTISQANLPNYNLSLASITIGVNDTTHAHSMSGTINSTNATGATGNNFVTSNAAGSTQAFTSLAAAAPAATSTGITTGTIGGTLPSGGSGTAMDFAVKYIDVIMAQKA